MYDSDGYQEPSCEHAQLEESLFRDEVFLPEGRYGDLEWVVPGTVTPEGDVSSEDNGG